MSLINPSATGFSDSIVCSLEILDSELREVRRCQSVLCSVKALAPPVNCARTGWK